MDDLIIANPAGAQAVYIADVDLLAERRREQFITRGSGQAMTYQAKYEEAVDFLNDGEGPFPHLEGEAEARDMTVEALAAEIVTMREQWKQASAQIETERARAKKRIRASDDPAAWRQAVIDFEAALPTAPPDV